MRNGIHTRRRRAFRSLASMSRVRTRRDSKMQLWRDGRRPLSSTVDDADRQRHPQRVGRVSKHRDRKASDEKMSKWSRRESNPLPPACHAGALPNELRPLFATRKLVIQRIDAAGRDGSRFVGGPHLKRRHPACQTPRQTREPPETHAFWSESTSLWMLGTATEQSATRSAPFSGTTKTPSSFIFAAASGASSTNIVTKKPPS